MQSDQPISIWFFIGGLMAIYGLLILATGVYELPHPPHPAVVLQGIHAGIWWGALLLALGLLYLWFFRPKRRSPH